MEIEDALSGEVMARNPEITWKYLLQIERSCRGAKPNRAHEVMVLLEQRMERVWVLTQNVDGLHKKAGSRNLIEIHGSFNYLYCAGCGSGTHQPDYSSFPELPLCDACGQSLRPDIVLFGEALPDGELETLHREMTRGFDVVFSVGTSSLFPYISLPVMTALHAGGTTVEINPVGTPVSGFVQFRFAAPAEQVLDDLWVAMDK